MDKTCTACGETKPENDFYWGGLRKGKYRYRMSRCKRCHNVMTRAYQRSHRQEISAHQRFHRHGMTVAEADQMAMEQDDRCYLCRRTPDEAGIRGPGRPKGGGGLTMDHDHQTGARRRLLCSNCNLAIGNAKDDPDLLRRMADYVETFRKSE